jgi:Tfp pilus assembly protein PilF
MGSVEYMQGNLDAAIIAIERAIQLNPNYAAAHHDLGGVLVAKMKGWCRKALQAFERAYQLAEHDPGFSEDDRARIQGYISWLQQQCGQGRE